MMSIFLTQNIDLELMRLSETSFFNVQRDMLQNRTTVMCSENRPKAGKNLWGNPAAKNP